MVFPQLHLQDSKTYYLIQIDNLKISFNKCKSNSIKWIAKCLFHRIFKESKNHFSKICNNLLWCNNNKALKVPKICNRMVKHLIMAILIWRWLEVAKKESELPMLIVDTIAKKGKLIFQLLNWSKWMSKESNSKWCKPNNRNINKCYLWLNNSSNSRWDEVVNNNSMYQQVEVLPW